MAARAALALIKLETVVKRLLRHPVVQNSLVLYAVQISGYLIPLITLPYLARVLAPEKFGLVAFAQSFIWYFVILTDYGFNLTAPRTIAIHRDDPAYISKVFSTIMAAKAILTIVGFFVMAAVVAVVPQFRAEWRLFSLCYLTVVGTAIFPLWLFQGLEKLQFVGLRDFTAKLITLACVIGFVHKQSDYLLAMAIQSGGLLLVGLLGLASVPFVTKFRMYLPSRSEIWDAAKEGWHVFLSMSAMSLYGSTNVVILGLVASPAAVGLFSAAYRVIVPLRQLVTPMESAIYPYVSRMAANEPERAVKFVRRYATWAALPFLLIGIGIVTLAPVAVRLGFGRLYEETGTLLRILAFSPMLLAISQCFGTQFMLGFGYTREWAKMAFQAGIVNFVTLAVLLAVMRPARAAAVTAIVIELFIVARSMHFYLRGAQTTAAPVVEPLTPSTP